MNWCFSKTFGYYGCMTILPITEMLNSVKIPSKQWLQC